MRFRSILVAVALTAPAIPSHAAGVPRTLAFQGVLASATGVPLAPGARTVTFRLYANAGDAVGSALWTETKAVTVSATRGLFNTALGDATAFPELVRFDQQYYLGIQISGEASEMVPRAALQSVPYAMGLALPYQGVVSTTGYAPLLNIVQTGDSEAIHGTRTTGTGTNPAIAGETYSTDFGAAAVMGTVTSGGAGAYSAGVRGVNNSLNTSSAGVYGSSSSGWGVFGTSGDGSGVFGSTNSGSGVLGVSTDGYGAYGYSANNEGVHGTHDGITGTAAGVHGETRSTDASAVAVLGTVDSTSPGPNSVAVEGVNNGTGYFGIGVHGKQNGSGWGVLGNSVNGIGVYGTVGAGIGVEADGAGSTRTQPALRATNTNTNGGIAAYLTNNSNFSTAHVANAGSGEVLYLQNGTGPYIKCVNNAETAVRFLVDANGEVYAHGAFHPSGVDFAESLPVAGLAEKQSATEAGYAPGDVLVLDETDGHKVRASSEPYCPRVAGVYATKPGVLASEHPLDGQRADEVPMAMVGQVPCRVTDEGGPIKVGDLLVTSSTPGTAMRATDRVRAIGCVVGKAMETLPAGTHSGAIRVLVSLQ